MWGLGHCCADNDPKICEDCYAREWKGRKAAMEMLPDILNDGAKFEHDGEEHEFHADFEKATAMVTEYFANNSLTVSPDAKREANTSGGIGSP